MNSIKRKFPVKQLIVMLAVFRFSIVFSEPNLDGFGVHFSFEKADVIWDLGAHLPRNVVAYRSLPKKITTTQIRNLIKIAQFDHAEAVYQILRSSTTGKTASYADGAGKTVEIDPQLGSIKYGYSHARSITGPSRGVPSEVDALKIATSILRRLNIEESNLWHTASSTNLAYNNIKIVETARDRRTKALEEDVLLRGIAFFWSIDNISCTGSLDACGPYIEFGNSNQVQELFIISQQFVPLYKCRSCVTSSLAEYIRNGKAVIEASDEEMQRLKSVKKIIIKDYKEFYSTTMSKGKQRVMYPYFAFSVELETETQKFACQIDCPAAGF